MERVLALLADHLGLDLSSMGVEGVASAVRRRMYDAGLSDAGELHKTLTSSSEELELLVEEVVVKESWFFRDSQPYHHLTHFVREQWSGRGTLRVLSAPCASGEEPYSLAMTLLEAGLRPADFAIDAVDISSRALIKAKEGIYGENSFRREDLDLRPKYFIRRGKSFVVRDQVKAAVRFLRRNLSRGLLAAVAGPYDVIFCRNFLIYLDAAAKGRVERDLHLLLAPEGVLCVGHAEAASMLNRNFSAVGWPRSFTFRGKPSALAAAALPEHGPQRIPAQAFDPDCLKGVRANLSRRRESAAGRPPRATPTQTLAAGQPQAGGLAAQARRLADQGRLAEALTLCEQALALEPLNPSGRHLAGIILHGLGREDEAEESLSRAVYLDPLHYEALTQLALIRAWRGDQSGARRLLARAERALARREHEAEVHP